MAITRGQYTTYTLTDNASEITYVHEVDEGTTLLVVTVTQDANESISIAPAGNTTETLSIIDATTNDTSSGGDKKITTYGRVNPSPGIANITFTQTTDAHTHSTAVNYLGTINSSVADATNFLSEDVNNSLTTTTVLPSGSATTGSTLFAVACAYGADGSPVTTGGAGFFQIANGETGGGSTSQDESFYVGDKIGGAPDSIIIDWAGGFSDENCGHLLEILPEGSSSSSSISSSSSSVSSSSSSVSSSSVSSSSSSVSSSSVSSSSSSISSSSVSSSSSSVSSSSVSSSSSSVSSSSVSSSSSSISSSSVSSSSSSVSSSSSSVSSSSVSSSSSSVSSSSSSVSSSSVSSSSSSVSSSSVSSSSSSVSSSSSSVSSSSVSSSSSSVSSSSVSSSSSSVSSSSISSSSSSVSSSSVAQQKIAALVVQ